MPEQYKQALLDGYVSADGHRAKKRVDCTTVSKRLAVGIRLLAESLGNRATLHKYKSHNTVIEGRTVNVKDQYRVVWAKNKTDRIAFQDELNSWSLVKSKEEGSRNVTDYNI